MEVKIFQQAQSHEVYVEARGRIVLDACETLKNTVLPHLNPKTDSMHIDLSNVDFIDSAGLGVLVGIKMTANKSKTRLILISPSKNVYDILYVSKLENIFDIVTGSEAELLRTSMSTPEFLIQQVSSKPAEGGPGFRAPDLAVAQKPEAPTASVVGANDNTVSARTGATAATAGPAGVDQAVTAPQVSQDMPIQEPLPAVQKDQDAQNEDDILNGICKQALELMRQGLYEKAAQKYEEALVIDPDYLPALNNLAIVYEKKPTWYPKAVEQWQRVLKVSESKGDQKHAKRAMKHLETLEKQP